MVHLPAKGPERVAGASLDARAREGVVLGFGRTSHSYCVYLDGAIKYYRTVMRMPLSRRWTSEDLEKVDISKQQYHGGRGARAVPFTDREPDVEVKVAPKRAARRLELRQSDFDPSLGGYGWTEHCPKCSRARTHGWRESGNTQHSLACRVRVEAELEKTELGKMRLDRIKDRLDRYAADQGPEQVVPGHANAGAEGR